MIKFKRAMSALMDYFFIISAATTLVYIVTLGTGDISPFSLSVFLISALVLVILKDYLLKGASLGKRIFRIKVVKVDGSRFTLFDAVKRTLTLIALPPIELFMTTARTRRIGDKWAKTMIVPRNSTDNE